VILCGGLGTRLGPLTMRVPKSMTAVAGRPFLEYELALLRAGGIEDFVLCVGYLGEAVQAHFGDGRRFGVRIRYAWDGPMLMGPAGALKRASRLLDDLFFVTYGDAYLRADYAAIMDRLQRSHALGVMTVYENDGMYGRSDVAVSRGYVTRYDKAAAAGELSWVNFGVSALRKRALREIPTGVPCGEQTFYDVLVRRHALMAFPVRRRFYEIGTPRALEEFSRYVSRHPSAGKFDGN